MSTTRRRVLKYGLGGAALLAIPAVGLTLRPTVMVKPPRPLQTFTPRQYSTLVALADTICPGGDGLPSAADLEIAIGLDSLFARMHPGVGSDLSAGLDLLENALAGALLDRRTRTFTASEPAARAAILDTWRSSSILLRRAVFKALRGFVVAAYWGDPRTWSHVDYPGQPDYSNVPSPPPFEAWMARKEAEVAEESP